MKKIAINLEGVRIRPGGKFDDTKVVSPDIIYEDGCYRMFYVGTSCKPEERKDYVILSATSTDGLNFVKNEQPIIGLTKEWSKVYSPNVVKIEGKYYMYFAVSIDGVYVIKRAVSNDCLNFKVEDGIITNINENHSKAVHTPKILIGNNTIYCYYTGSNDNQKIYSKKYPNHDFGNKFRIFLATSKNGVNFEFLKRIESIEMNGFVNYYGHNIIKNNRRVFLFFTAFDGYINRIYVSGSPDGESFTKPVCILKPDEKKGEIGLYSCALVPIGNGEFRIYYGARYTDNRWTINSATFHIWV